MQILASALPGFRDLRAPLLAGYLWLLFLWTLLKPDLTRRPNNEVAAAVFDLGKLAGPIWIGLGVGVASYLIGSVSQALSPLLSAAFSAIWTPVFNFVSRRPASEEGMPRAIARYEADVIQQYVNEAQRKLPGGMGVVAQGVVTVPPGSMEISSRGSAARRGLELELELPATLLLAERGKEPEPQLFSEADRLKSERELRLAVVPPLSALAIYLGWNQSAWWWLTLVPAAVLLWQAHSRNQDFRSLMIGAVERGLARSRSIDELKAWVESIPAEPPPKREAIEPSQEQKDDKNSPSTAGTKPRT